MAQVSWSIAAQDSGSNIRPVDDPLASVVSSPALSPVDVPLPSSVEFDASPSVPDEPVAVSVESEPSSFPFRGQECAERRRGSLGGRDTACSSRTSRKSRGEVKSALGDGSRKEDIWAIPRPSCAVSSPVTAIVPPGVLLHPGISTLHFA